MSKSDAKQWLDGLIEAQEKYMAYSDGEVCISYPTTKNTINLYAGIEILAKALDVILLDSVIDFGNGIWKEKRFEYRGYEVVEMRRIGE